MRVKNTEGSNKKKFNRNRTINLSPSMLKAQLSQKFNSKNQSNLGNGRRSSSIRKKNKMRRDKSYQSLECNNINLPKGGAKIRYTSTPFKKKTQFKKLNNNQQFKRNRKQTKNNKIDDSSDDSDCMIIDDNNDNNNVNKHSTKDAFLMNESGILVLDEDISIIDVIKNDVEESIKENSLLRAQALNNDSNENTLKENLPSTSNVNDGDECKDLFYIDTKPNFNKILKPPLYNPAEITIEHNDKHDNYTTLEDGEIRDDVDDKIVSDISSIDDDTVIFCGEIIDLNTPDTKQKPFEKSQSPKIIKKYNSNLTKIKNNDFISINSSASASAPKKNSSKKSPKQIHKKPIVSRWDSNLTCNTYNPNKITQTSGKRIVIIDGSNVAYAHSNNKYFSVEGLEICLNFFEKQGHDVKAVVPQSRLAFNQSNNQSLITKLKNDGKLILTPSKNLPGKKSNCYDDRFILQVASEFDAAIVSNDNYRDLVNENPSWTNIITTKVIGYTWFRNMFMVPKDPYGKLGPTLDQILNI